MISKTIQAAVAVGHDWVDGQYYDDAESAMEQQWTRLIWPLIEGSDFSTVLELAPGHGRNTAKLLPLSGHLYAVDINQTNIDFLDQRFTEARNLTAFKNEGVRFVTLEDAMQDPIHRAMPRVSRKFRNHLQRYALMQSVEMEEVPHEMFASILNAAPMPGVESMEIYDTVLRKMCQRASGNYQWDWS